MTCLYVKLDISNNLRRSKYKRICVLECNNCGNSFEKRWTNEEFSSRELHFCSSDCRVVSTRKSGILGKKTAEKFLAKFGSAAIFSSQYFKEKAKETLVEKYGVENVLLLPEIRKIAMERAWSPAAKNKRFLTNQSKFGTNMSIVGLHVSKPELHFKKLLLMHYIVESQTPVNGWPIDLYLPQLDLYIQIDGDYWHGKNIDNLRAEGRRYNKIIRQIWRDKEQNIFFKQNNLRLIRISDKEVNKCKSAFDAVILLNVAMNRMIK